MADSSPPGDQPRVSSRDVSGTQKPASIQYRVSSSKPNKRPERKQTRV